MSTRIALVMHDPLGAAFQACAQHVLGRRPDLTVFDIVPDADPADQAARILDWVRADGAQEPVLMLCDLYGATPFNIAVQARRQALEDGYMVHLLTGTNACMVLKALTDQQENPESFSERVRQGALRGIVNAEPPCDC
ncbi:PTS sugar transporter subunit IIA [Castellaniella ginsengisoli]|uniref:PTS fructose transporter subunit IIA n=1 Tax=Castellaniella ginsengisoli TaxID=546114 RepID=A0AB39ENN6_9BURK